MAYFTEWINRRLLKIVEISIALTQIRLHFIRKTEYYYKNISSFDAAYSTAIWYGFSSVVNFQNYQFLFPSFPPAILSVSNRCLFLLHQSDPFSARLLIIIDKIRLFEQPSYKNAGINHLFKFWRFLTKQSILHLPGVYAS